MRTNRRDLLLSAGAAVLAKKAQGQGSAPMNSEPAWKKLFPAGFRNERIKTRAPKSTRSSADPDPRC